MLVEFSVNNFRSIKDTAKLSMVASSNDNVFEIKKYKLLQSSVLYGANASGKSNVINAMAFMQSLVLNRYKIIQSTDILPYEPFRLNTETEEQASSFEIVFFYEDTKYRYGFELDSKTVYSEWLFADTNGREAKLFYRDIEEKEYVNPNNFKEGNRFLDKKTGKLNISQNQLFIWKCDQENGEISKKILQWFKGFNILSAVQHESYESFTVDKMKDENFRQEILKLLKIADFNIDDIKNEAREISASMLDDMPLPDFIKNQIKNTDKFEAVNIKTVHNKYDDDGNIKGEVAFELSKEESHGTEKFFAISAPILDTLLRGKVLVIDELDASLHPILTKHLIKLFYDKNINKNNAQLIFTTHDTTLLRSDMFKKDQVWLCEKDKFGATDLYSLTQIKGVYENDNFEKGYIRGKYGAIPYIGDFEGLIG